KDATQETQTVNISTDESCARVSDSWEVESPSGMNTSQLIPSSSPYTNIALIASTPILSPKIIPQKTVTPSAVGLGDGIVILIAYVDWKGIPRNIKVKESYDERASRNAMNAFRNWRFEPPDISKDQKVKVEQKFIFKRK
ncbi:MAG: energy transducer TonB, partial [Opitutales bacterium]